MKTTPTALKFAFLALVLTATAYAAFQCSFCKGTGWDKYGRTCFACKGAGVQGGGKR